MLYELLSQFTEFFSALNVTKYITFRAMIALSHSTCDQL